MIAITRFGASVFSNATVSSFTPSREKVYTGLSTTYLDINVAVRADRSASPQEMRSVISDRQVPDFKPSSPWSPNFNFCVDTFVQIGPWRRYWKTRGCSWKNINHMFDGRRLGPSNSATKSAHPWSGGLGKGDWFHIEIWPVTVISQAQACLQSHLPHISCFADAVYYVMTSWNTPVSCTCVIRNFGIFRLS